MFFKGLIWTVVVALILSVVAIIGNRDKIESDLLLRSFASLGQFNQGWVKMKVQGRDLTLGGQSPLSALHESALEALEAVPGVRIVKDSSSVKAKAAPYTWSASLTQTGLVLKGYVPSPELMADILEKAKLVSNGAAVENHMELADGAPEEDWSNAVEFALAHMDKLKSGSVVVDENAVRMEGEARDIKSYMALTEAFQGGGDAPDGYILASNVSTPRVANFTWSATRTDDGIILEGYAPNAESREEIEAMVVDVANGASIDNRLELASGEPADWEDRITFAIDHLKALKTGEIHISNSGITISGEAASNEGYDAMQAMHPPSGVTVTKKLSRPVITPFTWSASLDKDKLVLEGYVPDETTLKAVLDKARLVAGGHKVVDDMGFAAGAPEGWGKLTAFALENLGRMTTGAARLTDNELVLEGTARDEAALATLNALELPGGGKLTVNIAAPPKPEPDPAEIAAAKAAEEARAAEAAKAAEEAKAAEAAKAAEEAKAPPEAAKIVTLDVCQSLLNNIFELKQINFKTASAELKEDSKGTIEVVAFTMNRCPKAHIEIGGHTDSDGDDKMNLVLSEKRARSVKDALVKLGIAAERLTAVGYGETKPLVSNDTPENKAHNRRIEFIIKQ